MNPFPREKLADVLEFVWSSKYSSVYRDFWNNKGIKNLPTIPSKDNWEKLPLTSREMLSGIKNPTERCHVTQKDTDVLGATSGTSGQGPFLFWRTLREQSSHHNHFAKKNVKRVLLMNPYDKTLHTIIPMNRVGVQSLLGDPHNLEHSADLTQLAHVDALSASPSVLLAFAPFLEKRDKTKNITYIFLWGEYCSNSALSLIKKAFPKAYLVFSYGQSEACGTVASATSDCTDGNRVMHVHDESYYCEVIDGELIITTLTTPLPTPLIRYRTGDSARFVSEKCPCRNKAQRIEILGRIDGDIIRIAGGEVRAEELDRVMEQFLPYIEPTYQLEVDELIEDNKKIGVLTLNITIRENISTPEASLKTQITQELTENMRLTQTMRLKDAINSNLLKPLKIEVVPKQAKITSQKHLRLVRKSM